jgi:DNA-binding YbaB/EbfC family protein
VTSSDDPLGNLGNLMSQLGQMQENLRQAQEAAASELVEGSAGGGAVKVTVTGDMQFHEVHIDPAVVDPADVEMLQDLVLAAVRDAVEKAQAATAQALSGGIDLEGLGLGGLLGGGEPSSE